MAPRIPVRRLLTEAIERRLPEFVALDARTPQYWFRRAATADWILSAEGSVLNHVILFGHSAREAVFSVDLYSGIQPKPTSQYGKHAFQSLTPLPTLCAASRPVPMEESYYRHDRTEHEATDRLDQIVEQIAAVGVPWFHANELRLLTDPLVVAARAWLLEHWTSIPRDVGAQLDTALVAGGHRYANADLPLFQQLKDALRVVASALHLTASERSEIQPLAYQTLQYAAHRKANS